MVGTLGSVKSIVLATVIVLQDVLCSPSWQASYDIPDFPMKCRLLSYQNRTSARDYVLNGTINNNVEIFEECIPESC